MFGTTWPKKLHDLPLTIYYELEPYISLLNSTSRLHWFDSRNLAIRSKRFDPSYYPMQTPYQSLSNIVYCTYLSNADTI